ncbi:hypothetical protein GGI19_006005 [Coemansia pectinata]|uniref:Fungal-type protein kinase domain-containing protein n=1 Tax=Coemansia pectinata TaxID=1052879 RepID=A0A9W8GQ66_9FUNG|nr:hypothetical protein GGI19_006005 [Coemansia pectinata]
MERLLNPKSPNKDKADGGIATRTRCRIANTPTSGAATKLAASGSTSLAQGVSNLTISTEEPTQLGINDAQLATDFGKFKKWTQTKGDYDGSEKAMYDHIRPFITYVARHVKARLGSSSDPVDGKNECRLIHPVKITDYKPEDLDDSTRIEIGLIDSKYNADFELNDRASYYELRAILEVKVGKGKDDIVKAFAQLYAYTRQMFAEQHNLRSALGFTACAGDVRLCHFGPSKAVSSKPMDVATREGRRAFIELLANMSLCDESQLGRDPTMRYLSELRCWQIDCPDDDDDDDDNDSRRGEVAQYYFTNVICIADRLFGRHTRCFLATESRPTKQLEEGQSLEATVVIKDAFAFAKPIASEDDRDEVKTLKKIREAFYDNNPDDIFYPKIVVGGRVKFKRGSQLVEDTTSTIYEGVNSKLLAIVSSDSLFRAHRRIVMKSIGEPLRTIKTAKEFVAVICNAMQCHYAIVDKCKILHRDISNNNILVVRMEDGTVRGLLIDFDCAIDISRDKKDVRGEMTGTFPFMSLNNLTCSNVKRTSLDDWESVLYLLCWYATIGFGTGEDRSEVQARLKGLDIARWRNGTLITITNAKRAHLRNLDNFETDIVDRFDQRDTNSEHLGVFALDLYKALFANGKLEKVYYGTKEKKIDSVLEARSSNQPRPTPIGDDNSGLINPFALRAEKWEQISKDLLDVINETKMEMSDWKDTPKHPQ